MKDYNIYLVCETCPKTSMIIDENTNFSTITDWIYDHPDHYLKLSLIIPKEIVFKVRK